MQYYSSSSFIFLFFIFIDPLWTLPPPPPQPPHSRMPDSSDSGGLMDLLLDREANKCWATGQACWLATKSFETIKPWLGRKWSRAIVLTLSRRDALWAPSGFSTGRRESLDDECFLKAFLSRATLLLGLKGWRELLVGAVCPWSVRSPGRITCVKDKMFAQSGKLLTVLMWAFVCSELSPRVLKILFYKINHLHEHAVIHAQTVATSKVFVSIAF